MSKESRVKGTDYVRVTRDDGRVSYGYHEGVFSERYPDEIAIHHEDGTTEAYKPVNDVVGLLTGLITGDFRGEKK